MVGVFFIQILLEFKLIKLLLFQISTLTLTGCNKKDEEEILFVGRMHKVERSQGDRIYFYIDCFTFLFM